MKTTQQLEKIIVIVGATASGKSGLAVTLAHDIHGEVISADSRQIYTHLNLGTAKTTEEEMEGVPHHLIDCMHPQESFTTTLWVEKAEQLIKNIRARGHVPIIAGGTFLYIETLLGKKVAARVPPNPLLREKLERLSNEGLFLMLTEKDPVRAKAIDRHNPRRLIRALEIINALGKVPEVPKINFQYNALIIGLTLPKDTLKERIFTRLEERISKGLVEETKQVLTDQVTEDRLKEMGLEYRVVMEYLNGRISETEMRKKLQEKEWQYAKRQLTWLKKMEGVHWHDPKDYEVILKEVRAFLKK